MRTRSRAGRLERLQDSITSKSCESASVLCVCVEDGILVCVIGSVESGICGCDSDVGKGRMGGL